MNYPTAIENPGRQFVLPETHYYSIDPRLGHPVDVFEVQLPVVLEHPSGSHSIVSADGVLLLIASGQNLGDIRCPGDTFRQGVVSQICGHFQIARDGRLQYEPHHVWTSPPLPADFTDWIRGWWYGLSEAEQSHHALRMRHPGFPAEDLIKRVGGLETDGLTLEGESV